MYALFLSVNVQSDTECVSVSDKEPDIAGSPASRQQRALFLLQQDGSKGFDDGREGVFYREPELGCTSQGSRLNIILNSPLSSSHPVPEVHLKEVIWEEQERKDT